MKYSNLFVKTQKELPAQETSKNAELLIRAGFIKKELAGVYSYLPLGLRVLKKIENIVREEMDSFGVQEILMPALANKENWDKTGRWNNMDCLYKLDMAGGQKGALSPTHEETVTPLAQQQCKSYKDFPFSVYQIQTKFRNEARAKSGLLRGREFLMKDAYSFHTSQECFESYYEKMKEVYFRIYDRLGIGDITKIVSASGGDFSKHSHEYQTLCEIGEDEIYIDKNTGEALNKEIVSEEDQASGKYETKKAIEVGNIFPLSTKFSDSFNFTALGKDGKPKEIIMGCYGFGVSRVMGALVEIFHDEKGMKWPKSVAPFKITLIGIGKLDAVYEKCEILYAELKKSGIEVFYDDRRDKKVGPGQKFADHELMGIPYRVIVSERGLESNEAEIVNRKNGETEIVSLDDVLCYFQK